MRLLIFAIVMAPVMAFAQVAAPVVAPTFLDGILAWLQANPVLLASAASVLEILLRVIPSQKALSLLVPVEYVIEKLALIFSIVAGVLKGLIASANNVQK